MAPPEGMKMAKVALVALFVTLMGTLALAASGLPVEHAVAATLN